MKTNMKLGFAIAAFISLVALPALAQNDQGSGLGQGQGQRFQQAKSRILQRLKDREACVEAANSFQDLFSCRPNRQGGGQDNGPQGGPDDGNEPNGNDSGGSGD